MIRVSIIFLMYFCVIVKLRGSSRNIRAGSDIVNGARGLRTSKSQTLNSGADDQARRLDSGTKYVSITGGDFLPVNKDTAAATVDDRLAV